LLPSEVTFLHNAFQNRKTISAVGDGIGFGAR